mmetsp:Transcript_97739/g.203942  ORF Transcript_97739/g.203942 Transcript_97739/m.203942 type:complete len:429 (-) Transcript_97739:37-1323(-)
MPASRSRSRSRGRERERELGLEVEAFLRAEPEIEERAATMLRTKGPEVQRLVLARGGLAGTRNPTAVLVSRIRNAEEGLRPVLEAERAPEEIERFLIIERVEPHAAARLRRAPREVQTSVVSRGSLAGTRDPTAVLMTRIRDAEKEHAPATSTDIVAAAQAAVSAATESTDIYSSDPQAYALAYWAQYQAAYPQAVQGAVVPSMPTLQLAAPGMMAIPDGAQVVHVAGPAGMQAYQLPPGYQLFPVGVANPDGTIGALPASFGGTEPAKALDNGGADSTKEPKSPKKDAANATAPTASAAPAPLVAAAPSPPQTAAAPTMIMMPGTLPGMMPTMLPPMAWAPQPAMMAMPPAAAPGAPPGPHMIAVPPPPPWGASPPGVPQFAMVSPPLPAFPGMTPLPPPPLAPPPPPGGMPGLPTPPAPPPPPVRR